MNMEVKIRQYSMCLDNGEIVHPPAVQYHSRDYCLAIPFSPPAAAGLGN